MREAQYLLKKWEEADEEVLSIWRLLNDWAYEGFKSTYDRLGIEFDKTDYESKTYLLGKEIVERGLYDGVFQKKPDGSVWADLSDEGLDEKLLLRSDGTSVYITQDLGTAESRYLDFMPEKLIYVVGNEQIYHFEVLKKLLKKLGNEWYNRIFHLSYGMVELPSGRMKSREGTVVDADDLMDEMFETAVKTTGELGKTESFSKNELKRLNQIVSMGALKYFILKVDPKKNMLFNPEESIDFNGNTGPFIQYTFARIQSVIRKSGYLPEQIITQINYSEVTLTEDEKEIIKTITEFPLVVSQAAELFNPSIVANYCYDLARKFNHFYQDQPILMRISNEVAIFRVALSWFTGNVLKKGMFLLGIELPEKM
jgi:arginyl-tRNA synthetase